MFPLRQWHRWVVLAVLSLAAGLVQAANVTLLNVSYDPTRELYKQYDAAFAQYWKAKTGDVVTVRQSHGAPPSRPGP